VRVRVCCGAYVVYVCMYVYMCVRVCKCAYGEVRMWCMCFFGVVRMCGRGRGRGHVRTSMQ